MSVQFEDQVFSDISSTAKKIHDSGMNTKSYLEKYPDHRVVSPDLDTSKYEDILWELNSECKLSNYGDPKIQVYLAGPYFTESHKNTIDTVRQMLMKLDDRIVVYSPFHDGIDFTEAGKNVSGDKSLVAKMIFSENIAAIDKSHIILALVDDRDPGTIMEIGYAVGKDKPVITYSGQDYGVNLMISNSSVAHYTNLREMVEFVYEDGEYLKDVYYAFNKLSDVPLGVIDTVTLAKDLLEYPGDTLEANR